jgi:sarcosine dehydrogenase
VLNLCGPRSREVLAKVAEELVDAASFKFGQAKRLTVGAAPILALRVSYTGELGYELHVPTEYAVHVYRLLMEAGAEFGIANVGYRALNSLRVEKGYVVWATDVTPDYSPHHARLEKLISRKKGDFIGRDALEKIGREGPDRLLCIFALDKKVPVFGGEAILRNGKVLGVTSSGDFGHTIGKPVVYGYVAREDAGHGDYIIEVYGEAVAAKRAAAPLYDPEGTRFRS